MKYSVLFFGFLWMVVNGCQPERKEITIFLAGDSTMADKPFRNGNPEKGWGQILPLYFDEGVRIDNHARNGRSTKCFIDNGLWGQITTLVKPGDYVFIQFGHNDSKSRPDRYAEAYGAYSSNLIRMVEDVRALEAVPVLCTSIVRRRFDDQHRFYDTHGDYPDAVRRVADSLSVVLIDMHHETEQLIKKLGKEESKLVYIHLDAVHYDDLDQNIQDDTHFSPYGAFRMCDIVTAQIRMNIPELAQFLKE